MPYHNASAGPPVPWESYVPNPRQALFHGIKRWAGWNRIVKGAVGGLGSGKSTACMQELVDVAHLTPGGVSVVCRESMPKAEASVINDLSEILGKAATIKSTPRRFVLRDGGHQIMLMPADEWDRFGSTEFVVAYIMEAQETKYQIFSTLNERLRNRHGIVNGIPYYRTLVDARGVGSRHWVNTELIKKAWNVDTPIAERRKAEKPFYVYQKFQTFDNPRNRPGYVEELLEDHKNDPAWIRMMIYGDIGYDISGRPVYGDSYRPALHDADIEPDPTLPILRGWDFGYRSPAVVFCQFTRDGRLLILREITPRETKRAALVDMVEALQAVEFPSWHATKNFRDFGDIAGEQETDAGVGTVEYVETRLDTVFEGLRKDHVEAGLEVVRGLMTRLSRMGSDIRPCFLVDRRCETLREALRGLYFYENLDDNTKKPKKGMGYDDVCDAVRYVAQTIVAESGDRGTGESDHHTGDYSYANY